MMEVGDAVVAPHTTFDMTSFISSALTMGCADYLSHLAAMPITSAQDSPVPVSPTGSNSSSGRKRRRGEVANPANTLDGLVARRAEDRQEDLGKRFMTEDEAIESPDEQTEMRRMEQDPDVNTRTCSICQYQGKWVSEMIRHKRVHTNDRPFKCRFCVRTSKWKADLIRHVAKTHGIRVVSKYSRSKTFDPSTAALGQRQEDDKQGEFCEETQEQRQTSVSPSALSTASVNSTATTVIRPEPITPTRSRSLTYRCNHCDYEQEAYSLLTSHLTTAHSLSAYRCDCGLSFDCIDGALKHCNQGRAPDHAVANFTTVYNKANPLSALSVATTLSPSQRSDVSPDSGLNTDSDESENETKIRFCAQCPFKSSSDEEIRVHNIGHELPSHGPLNFKCPFCPWYNKKRAAIEEHMRLHTSQTRGYDFGDVDRSLMGVFPPHATPFGLMSPLGRALADPRTPHLPSAAAFDLTTALLALQAQMTPAYMSNMASIFSAQSAFTPTSVRLPVPEAFPPRPTHSCSKCDAVFSDVATLQNHQKFHGSQLKHACPLCDYSVRTTTNILRHMQSHHRSATGDLAECLPEVPDVGSTSDEEMLNVEE